MRPLSQTRQMSPLSQTRLTLSLPCLSLDLCLSLYLSVSLFLFSISPTLSLALPPLSIVHFLSSVGTRGASRQGNEHLGCSFSIDIPSLHVKFTHTKRKCPSRSKCYTRRGWDASTIQEMSAACGLEQGRPSVLGSVLRFAPSSLDLISMLSLFCAYLPCL